MNVCVFAGSFKGRREAYEAGAVALGRAIAERGWTLVYGGAEVGLMGTLADATLAARGKVVGVVPRNLLPWERPHPNLTELTITEDISSRKDEMARLAEAFVCLPGGLGTMEELFAVWTSSQLGIDIKPVSLLNIEGFYDGLVRFLETMVAENLLQQRYIGALVVDRDPATLLDALERWEPTEPKWATVEARRLAHNTE